MEKWLKRIWLINGLVVFIASFIFISDRVQTYFQYKSKPSYGPVVGERLNAARKESLAIQDIYTSIPRRIGKSSFSFVEIASKDLEKAIRVSMYADYERDRPPAAMRYIPETEEYSRLSSGGVINLAFINDNGNDTRLLLNRKACIIGADIPQYPDTLQNFILYRIVSNDTNGDGRLTYKDETNLFISDLNGLRFRQVNPDSIAPKELIKSFRRNKLIFRGQFKPQDKSTPEKDWKDQVFTYDLQTGKLEPLLPNKTVLDLARQILWAQ